MRLRYELLTLIVLIGCSKPKTNEVHSIDTDTTDNIAADFLIDEKNDTLSYVGYIGKFEDNSSFYTDLYFVDNFDYDLYDEITKLGNQPIFKDEETQRTRIEIEKAGQYFNLTGLTAIDIYNKENVKLTTGRLSHIEYVEDMIESSFVAVFQVDDPDIFDFLFCVGNSTEDLTKIDFSSHKDEKLKSELIDLLKLNINHIWRIEHYKLSDQTIYSTLSADTTAYIIETINNGHKTLYKSKSSETINSLNVISKKINGRPILLTECAMPETDMMWNSVLIFNGTDYEPSKNHRISGR
ncbi:MAG: hypothetical protein KF763_21255 [Cyclobacteriaceae bacterium]|nr:hypothetical protein [Cyclobacteriaceae bacterium]